MAYIKLNLKDGDTLTAAHLAHIESGITTINKSDIGLDYVENVRQYSVNNPPILAQPTAPDDSNVLWIDTSDDSDDGLQDAVNMALAQAKASGEFDGKTPEKGIDYFTNADKSELISAVIAALPVYSGEVI